jgi:CheY-like chemotaxis protein
MKNVHLLLIEDNEGDIILTTEALNDAQIMNRVTVMRDGAQALEFLTDTAKSNPAELPDLILLDINLPKINGIEILKSLKGCNVLQNIHVAMVTTSSSPTDIDEAYSEKADVVITKPLDADKIFGIIKGIRKIGISLVILPANMKNE